MRGEGCCTLGRDDEEEEKPDDGVVRSVFIVVESWMKNEK